MDHFFKKPRTGNCVSFFIFIMALSCGVNIYDPLTEDTTDEYYLRAAEEALNDAQYTKASENLAKVTEATNEKVMLQVGVKLGQAQLSFWQIILNMIKSSSSLSGSSGVDKMFNYLTTTIFGEESEKESRLGALNESITLLNGAPVQDRKTKLFSCFLAGILTYPRVTDGSTALQNTLTQMSNIDVSDPTSCPDTTPLQTALTTLGNVQADFQLILQQVSNCDMFSYGASDTDLNQVEKSLKNFTDNADKGCSTSSCSSGDVICEKLKSSCLSQILYPTSDSGNSTAQSGDGKVEVCELLLNCQTPSNCFSTSG